MPVSPRPPEWRVHRIPDPKLLSLKAAYKFAAEHGLEEEAHEIKNMHIKWDTGRNPDSSVRRGHMIRLFQSKGVLEEFCGKYWPYYDTKQGKTKSAWYLEVAARHDRYPEGLETARQPAKLSRSEQIDDEYYLIAKIGTYRQYRYKDENDLERLVEACADQFFGSKSIYFPLKWKVHSASENTYNDPPIPIGAKSLELRVLQKTQL